MKTKWNFKALQARIRDKQTRSRYEAGSPNSTEIGAYASALSVSSLLDVAVVLGITPELRLMATSLFEKVVTIDKSREAIKLYADWIPYENRQREVIVRDDWFRLPRHVKKPVSAVLGDGVFGNLPDKQSHQELLKLIASVLSSSSLFVTRKAVIPNGFRPEEDNAISLIRKYRKKEIDEVEFGFGMRLLGHYSCCYDPETCILDNMKLFRECESDLANGKLTKSEYSFIQRYYYPGSNCIIPQRSWEKMLVDCGFDFEVQNLQGKTWYEYYKIYVCSLKPRI